MTKVIDHYTRVAVDVILWSILIGFAACWLTGLKYYSPLVGYAMVAIVAVSVVAVYSATAVAATLELIKRRSSLD